MTVRKFQPGDVPNVRDMNALADAARRQEMTRVVAPLVMEHGAGGATTLRVNLPQKRLWTMRVRKVKIAGVEYTTNQLPAMPGDISYQLYPDNAEEVPDGFSWSTWYTPQYGRPVRNNQVAIYHSRIDSACFLMLNENITFDDERLNLWVIDEQVAWGANCSPGA